MWLEQFLSYVNQHQLQHGQSLFQKNNEDNLGHTVGSSLLFAVILGASMTTSDLQLAIERILRLGATGACLSCSFILSNSL